MTFIQYQKSLSTYKKYYSLYYQIPTKGRGPAFKFFNQNKPFSTSNFILMPSNSLNGEITKLKKKAEPLYINKFIYKHVFFAMPVYQRASVFLHKKYGCGPLFNMLKRGLFDRQSVSFFLSPNSLRIQNSFAFHSYDQKWNHKFIITIQNFKILIKENETQFSGGAFNILAKRQRFIRNSLKGILLVNFPEKEKNFLIKNLAAENKIALITQSASLLLKDSRNMDDLLGVDDPIQILFDKVKTCIPCLCFINNLDRIGKQRYEQEQKSLHWLNNSISLSLDQHFTSDRIFNTINTKQNLDFLDSISSLPSKLNDRRNLTRVLSARSETRNKKFSLNTNFNRAKGGDQNKQFNRPKGGDQNKIFELNYDFKNSAPAGILKNIEKFQITRFKNVQSNNQTVFKYLTWFNQPANKNKLKSIRPFLTLLVKLSIGSQDFMYFNSKKQLFSKLSIKKTIPLPSKDPYFDKASFRWLGTRTYLKQAPLFFKKYKGATGFLKVEKRQILLNTNVISPYKSLDGVKKNIFVASKTQSARIEPSKHFWLTKRKKHVSDNASKFKNSYYHRLPFWLFKNSFPPEPHGYFFQKQPWGKSPKFRPFWPFFFQHKINIAKVKLFNWFYDKKKKEENVLTCLKATVNPLLLQMAFCQSRYNTTNPIFTKSESNMIDPQTNLENLSTSSKIPLLKNSLIKSNNTKIYGNKFKSISKINMYDTVLSARAETRKKKLSFKDLGKINTEQKHKISKIFVNSNMQSFNFRTSVFSKNFEKTNASVFKDMPVYTEFKESTSYDSLFNNKQEPDKNNLFKITETETIKRTALLKFLQILDGFHTTRVYKYKQTWFKPFSYIKDFGLINNFSSKHPSYNEDPSSKSATRWIYDKSSVLIGPCGDFLTSQVLTKKEKRDNIKNIDLAASIYIDKQNTRLYFKQAPLFFGKNQSAAILLKRKKRRVVLNTDAPNNIQFFETNTFKKGQNRLKNFNDFAHGCFFQKQRCGFVGKLKPIKKSTINNTIMLFKPFHPRTSIYQKIYGPVQSYPKNNSLSYALQTKTFQYLWVTSKIPKWEVYLKNQPFGKALNLLCVWPSYIDDIMGPLNINDSASYLLPEYFQLLGHGPTLKKQGITLIASTDNLATLDAALLRPGRFDTIINFSHTLSSISKTSKILKHSPSLIQNRIFSLSVSFPINQLTSSVSLLSFINLSKTIKNQFYPQVTVLDIPNQSISIKTFIDVSVFIQYKLWWSFNHEKLSWFRLYKKSLIQKAKRPRHVSDFENSLNGIFKSNMSVVILILKFPIKKIKNVTYTFIRILRIIYFQFSSGAFYNFFKYFGTFKEKGSTRKLIGAKDTHRSFSALSENSDINQINEQFIINQSSNQKQETNSINALSREVLTSRIVNLGLSKNLSTLNRALNPDYISNQKAWMIANDKNKTINTYENAKNFTFTRTESRHFHIKDNDMFLKSNRGLLFCKGDFDYRTYSKNNSEIILTKTNPRTQSGAKDLKSEFGIFAESIRVKPVGFHPIASSGVKRQAEPELGFKNDNQSLIDYEFLNPSRDASFSSNMKKKRSAIAIKNVNINNVMLTKYNEIYKLKKIKLKKQSFFNLHPFSLFMLKRWSEITKSNKLKRHLNISLVNTHLPWKNEIYNTNDFDFSKLLNMKANLHNHHLKYDKNHHMADLNEHNDLKRSNIEKPFYFPDTSENLMAFSFQNSWSSNFDIMSLYNKIYHHIYSTTLLMPIPISLLKRESLKTLSTNSFSTYESYLFKKLRTNFSLNIIGLQIDSTLTSPLKQLLEGQTTDLKKGINNEVSKDLQMSMSLPNNDLYIETENEKTSTVIFREKLGARPPFWREKKVGAFKHEYSKTDNYKASLTYKKKISNIYLLEKKNVLKKIPRRNIINHTYNDFQAKCKFKYLKKNKSETNNNIILLKNLASNKKKEHNFIKTYGSFFQKAPPKNYLPLFNKFNGGFQEMCRLDTSFFILIFYTMFFEKIQHKKITLNTIKIFMPYRSLIFSHFLLSKADTYGFSCKNFEILIYNKFKNFLDL